MACIHQMGSGTTDTSVSTTASALKIKLLSHGSAFASLEKARLEVAYSLDTYFNLDRRHSALGYRSPHQFERDFQTSLSYMHCPFSLDRPIARWPTCACSG